MNEDQEKQHEQEQEPNEKAQPSEIEKRASRMGWRPKEEFRGDPNRWIDAEGFVDRTERELPIALGTIKTLERRLADTEATIHQFAAYAKTTEERAYQRALKSLQKEQRDAVAVGDTDKFDAAQKEIDEVIKQREQLASKTQAPAPTAQNRDFEAWTQRNPWYGSDPDMTRIADEVSRSVVAAFPELVGKRGIYDKYDEALKLRMGDKLNGANNPRRSDPPAVAGASGGGDAAASSGGKKSYAALPAEAKAACDKFVKAGLLTREQYLKDYDWD